MQTDVQASAALSATGNVKEATGTSNLGRARIKGAYYTASVAGSIELRDGGASGPLRATLVIGATSDAIPIPGQGVLFQTDVHATIVGATVTGITFFYT